MLSLDTLNSLKCTLESNDHFLEKPLILTCGHNACKSCVESKSKLKTK